MPKPLDNAKHEKSDSTMSDAAEKMLELQFETLNNLASQFIKTVNYSTEVSEIVSRKIVALTIQQSSAVTSAHEELAKLMSTAGAPTDMNGLVKMHQQFADTAMRNWTETSKRNAEWSKDLVARIMEVSAPK